MEKGHKTSPLIICEKNWCYDKRPVLIWCSFLRVAIMFSAYAFFQRYTLTADRSVRVHDLKRSVCLLLRADPWTHSMATRSFISTTGHRNLIAEGNASVCLHYYLASPFMLILVLAAEEIKKTPPGGGWRPLSFILQLAKLRHGGSDGHDLLK